MPGSLQSWAFFGSAIALLVAAASLLDKGYAKSKSVEKINDWLRLRAISLFDWIDEVFLFRTEGKSHLHYIKMYLLLPIAYCVPWLFFLLYYKYLWPLYVPERPTLAFFILPSLLTGPFIVAPLFAAVYVSIRAVALHVLEVGSGPHVSPLSYFALVLGIVSAIIKAAVDWLKPW